MIVKIEIVGGLAASLVRRDVAGVRQSAYPRLDSAVEESERMQRVRIGLTGLAFVFLAVLLAAIFTSQPAGEAPLTANLIAQQKAGAPGAAPAPPAAAEPTEPLAELGVAPGTPDSNSNASPPPATARPR
jgi:hypothetical protein